MNYFGGFTKSGFSVLGQALESIGSIVAPDEEILHTQSHEEGDGSVQAKSVDEEDDKDQGSFDNIIQQYIHQKREEHGPRPKIEKKLLHKPIPAESPNDGLIKDETGPESSAIPPTISDSTFNEVTSSPVVPPSPTSSLVEITLEDDEEKKSKVEENGFTPSHAFNLSNSHFHETSFPSIESPNDLDRRMSITSTLSNELESPVSHPSSQWSQNYTNPIPLNNNNNANTSSLSMFSTTELEKKIQTKYRENLEGKYKQLETKYLQLQNDYQLNIVKLQLLEDHTNINDTTTTDSSSTAAMQEYEKLIASLNITIHGLTNENAIQEKKMAQLTQDLSSFQLKEKQHKDQDSFTHSIQQQNQFQLELLSKENENLFKENESLVANNKDLLEKLNELNRVISENSIKEKELAEESHWDSILQQNQFQLDLLSKEKENLTKENELLIANNQDLLEKLNEFNAKNLSLQAQTNHLQNEMNQLKQDYLLEKNLVVENEKLLASKQELSDVLMHEKNQLLSEVQEFQHEKKQWLEKEKGLLYENTLLTNVNKENETINQKYEKLIENLRLENEELLNSMKLIDEKNAIMEKNYFLLTEEFQTLQKQVFEAEEQSQPIAEDEDSHLARIKQLQSEEETPLKNPSRSSTSISLQVNVPQPISVSTSEVPEVSSPPPRAKSPLPHSTGTNHNHDIQLKIISNYLISIAEKLQYFCEENNIDNPLPTSVNGVHPGDEKVDAQKSPTLPQKEEILLNYLHNTFQLIIQKNESLSNDIKEKKEEALLSLQLMQQLIVKQFPELQRELQALFASPNGKNPSSTNNNQFLIHSMISILEQNILSLQVNSHFLFFLIYIYFSLYFFFFIILSNSNEKRIIWKCCKKNFYL
jgi:hypothetical protein